MKKVKLLFQGDSITDAERDRSNFHDLGNGYPKYAAQFLREKYSDISFEFIDLGISGNETKDLVDRLQTDFIDIDPDVVSILIGFNDVWHHADDKSWIADEVSEARFRTVLTEIKSKTNAKIMILEPFLIPVEDKLFLREDLYRKIEVVRKLAREFADVYVPLDGLLSAAFVGDEPTSFAADGIHPTAKGAEYIGRIYCEYFEKLV